MTSVSIDIPSPFARNAPVIGPSLSIGRRLELVELLRRGRVLLLGELEQRRRVDVVVAERVVVEVGDRVLVAIGVGERVAVLAQVDRLLERGLGPDDQEVVDHADGRAVALVERRSHAAVLALHERRVARLLELLERRLGRVRVLAGHDDAERRLLLREVGGPDAGLLAEPRREVLLPGEAVALLGERLVDLLPHSPAGSSVRKSLPAAASASSRRAPSGCTTDCAYTGAPAGTSDAGSASPPEDDDDDPQAAATVASATQVNESAVARSMRSSPFEVPVQFPPTSSGGRDDTSVGGGPDTRKTPFTGAGCTTSPGIARLRPHRAPRRKRLEITAFRVGHPSSAQEMWGG